jgi:hypothetical protein
MDRASHEPDSAAAVGHFAAIWPTSERDGRWREIKVSSRAAYLWSLDGRTYRQLRKYYAGHVGRGTGVARGIDTFHNVIVALAAQNIQVNIGSLGNG